MDDYYAQQYHRSSFQSMRQQSQQSPQSPHIKRRMSSADYNTLNGGDNYTAQMMNQGMANNNISNQAMLAQASMPDTPGNMGVSMGQQNMHKFTGSSGGSRANTLDGFQFSPSVSSSGMMMPAGSIFRNTAAANSAVAAMANQQLSPSINISNQFMSPTSPYGSMMPPNSNYQNSLPQNGSMNLGMSGQYMPQTIPQNMSLSMDYADPTINAMLNDTSNTFNLMSQEQLMQSMMASPQQHNIIPTLSRDSTRSSQDPGGGDRIETRPEAERHNSNSSAQRQNSYASGEHRKSNAESQPQSFSPNSPPEHSQIQSNPAYPPNMQTRQQQSPNQLPQQLPRSQKQQTQQQQQQQKPQKQEQQQQQHSHQPPQQLPREQNNPNTQAQQLSNQQRQQQQLQQIHEHQQQQLRHQQQQQRNYQQQQQQQQQQQNHSQNHQNQQRQQQQHHQQRPQPTQQQSQYYQRQTDQSQQFNSQTHSQSQRPDYLTNRSDNSNSQQWNTPSQLQKYQQNMPMRQPPKSTNYMNAYSSTGFDMMEILMRVATRPNAEISIGAVDLSCAFVVCDVKAHDFPIVYCSENFERLTGYTKHEILGRNCRFLQAPNGKVQAGIKRSYVDDDSVLYLKNMITLRKEAQVSIINYRKGGQPFMNLLTMIPICYDSDDIKFFVGFQVDLVEQPNSVTNKNPDGSYTVNYQRGLSMPRYVYSGNEGQSTPMESGQTIPRDDVSTVLSTIGSGESELSRRIFDKVLLENTDDVIFVLSLKGLFLYLSPSSGRILEYETNELSGTALSSICHPSDIVPVTRELRDTATAASVNIVFRIRRKHNGYMWFEGSGSLHTEQGKGRKSIVMVGRERPVYTLSKVDIMASGGINDNEVWTKLSTAGLFLFVSGSVRQLLDKQPEELVGTSMQALMRPDSKQDFMRILEVARAGKRASCKHDLMNRRGQVLQAFTTLYPGDASEGQKPTFVVAQTRLLKYSRSGSTSATRQNPQIERTASGSIMTTASPASSQPTSIARSQSMSFTSPQGFMSTFEAATTFAGGHGLELGRQDLALASEENLFEELKTTRSTSWQFELRQMEKRNRLLAEELQGLLAARKKRKRRKGSGNVEKDCANCHTRVTPEWRRGPSGNRDLCNSCGLRWAKQQGRISPRTTNSARSVHSAKSDRGGPSSPLHNKNMSNGGKRRSSIDGQLAETGEPINQRNGSERHESSASHVSKALKVEADSGGVSHTTFGGGSSLPTKIEEGEEGDEDDDGDDDMN